jgi:hypothetical protein
MTRIELKTKYGSYIVEVNEDDLDIYEVVEQLVVPVLTAAGYAPDNVREALGGEE